MYGCILYCGYRNITATMVFCDPKWMNVCLLLFYSKTISEPYTTLFNYAVKMLQNRKHCYKIPLAKSSIITSHLDILKRKNLYKLSMSSTCPKLSSASDYSYSYMRKLMYVRAVCMLVKSSHSLTDLDAFGTRDATQR